MKHRIQLGLAMMAAGVGIALCGLAILILSFFPQNPTAAGWLQVLCTSKPYWVSYCNHLGIGVSLACFGWRRYRKNLKLLAEEQRRQRHMTAA